MEREDSGTSQGRLNSCKGDGKQANSRLKAIRPKVYITDSSSFKRLVQELTGNGNQALSSPQPTQELPSHAPAITIEEYGEPGICNLGEGYGGMQMSIDSQNSGIPTLSPLAAFTALQTRWVTQEADELQFPEVDAWPLEIDSFSHVSRCSFQTDEDLLFPPYDLSELHSIL